MKKNITKKKSLISQTKKAKSKGQLIEANYHHGDLRNLVLIKSCEFLEARGVYNLSLRDVAAAIGVSHTAPYRHFPKKIDLLYAITSLGFKELRDTLRDAWNLSDDPIVKLNQAGENYIRLAWKNPRRTELMFSGEIYLEGPVPEELSIVGREAYMGLYDIIALGQERGVFKKDDDAETLSMSVWSAVHGFANLNERNIRSAKTEEDVKKIEQQLVALLRLIQIGIKVQT
ncbi:MAG: TetR/AcrR family transcriptional regulator [Leptospira sp.]|nr:TetR/AcrR family transcriptional regulator [Leptospira sp.]